MIIRPECQEWIKSHVSVKLRTICLTTWIDNKSLTILVKIVRPIRIFYCSLINHYDVYLVVCFNRDLIKKLPIVQSNFLSNYNLINWLNILSYNDKCRIKMNSKFCEFFYKNLVYYNNFYTITRLKIVTLLIYLIKQIEDIERRFLD